jgi:hypothetical protein
LFCSLVIKFVPFLKLVAMASSSGSVAASGTAANIGFIKPTVDNLDIAW